MVELAVANLGVVDDLRLTFAEHMTALTGETGAGKTMIVEAIGLLMGGKADSTRVRSGSDEAVVEGLFVIDDIEVVLRRVVPASGRSRGYVDGRLATVTELAAAAAPLVELHGQHAQQSIVKQRSQREALDAAGRIDATSHSEAVSVVRALRATLDGLGGDERARAREMDLLRYQLAELESAAVLDPDEDERLVSLEEILSDAVAHREAGSAGVGLLVDEDGACDLIARAVAGLDHRAPFAEVTTRLRSVSLELADLSSELRSLSDTIEEDPDALATIRVRRQLLVELRRKYGEQLADVIEFQRSARERLAELESRENRLVELDAEIGAAEAAERMAAAELGANRRTAAPVLAEAVRARLSEVGMAKATVRIEVGADPGSDVEFLLAANPGAEPQPISKVASGGELSRVMLALHLELSAGADTLVFDEVDAGIGGSTATSIGRALADLAAQSQVIVVTHLPQVAAFADHQVAVTKSDDGRMSSTSAIVLGEPERVIELSRMLSGTPDSELANAHADELLGTARESRAR